MLCSAAKRCFDVYLCCSRETDRSSRASPKSVDGVDNQQRYVCFAQCLLLLRSLFVGHAALDIATLPSRLIQRSTQLKTDKVIESKTMATFNLNRRHSHVISNTYGPIAVVVIVVVVVTIVVIKPLWVPLK